MKIQKKVAAGVATAALLLGATGCNVGADASKGMGDSGVDQTQINKTPAPVVEFSDKYPDIEDKCDGHGHRIYVNTRSAGFFVVLADPTCPSK